MNFDNTLTYLFSDISNLFRQQLEKKLIPLKIHGGQVFILIELWKEDGLSQVVLANKLKITPPTINKMVKSLEQKDLIKSSFSESDGRVKLIFLTIKGKELEVKVSQAWEDFESNFFKEINETEKLIFNQLLSKIQIS